mgnify:CR=1 FL=1
MTIIWIRHGFKQYKNGKNPEGTFQYDPGLRPGHEYAFDSIRLNLVHEYGPPTMVISSPYQRTMETARGLALSSHIMREPLVCEFLGHQKPGTEDLRPSTIMEGLSSYRESFKELRKRCREHVTKIQETTLPGEVVWCITHGLVMKYIMKVLHEEEKNFSFDRDISFHELDFVVLSQNNVDHYPSFLKEDVLHRMDCYSDYRDRHFVSGDLATDTETKTTISGSSTGSTELLECVSISS